MAVAAHFHCCSCLASFEGFQNFHLSQPRSLLRSGGSGLTQCKFVSRLDPA